MHNILIAGFGGQGVLFTGKVMAYIGLLQDKEVSWFPSYGPEMRGGTANCSVCISTDKIGSPVVTEPNVLIAMNFPSYDKMFKLAVPNGIVVLDKSLVDVEHNRKDVNIFEIEATKIAQEEKLDGLSSLILLGKTLKETNIGSVEIAEAAIKECVSDRREHLLEANKRALRLGYSL
jgi:2-oxoglutarate ferredoxin oxidoreductase subunit gamma